MRSGKRLGEVLLESGLLDERDLGRLLADQKGLRFVELSGFAHDPSATALLSAEKAHLFAALPVGFEDGVPLVAVADPSNEHVTENLRRALGKEPRLVVASRSDLHATIDRLHATPGEEPVAERAVAEPVAELLVVSAVEPLLEPVSQPEPVFEAVQPAAEPVASAPEPVYESELVAPVLHRRVQVEHVEPLQPETNGYTTVAPLTELAPAAPEPVAVESEPEPVAVEPEPESVVIEPLVVEPAAAQPAEPEFPTALSYGVSLRLTDGERVQIGSFGEAQKARGVRPRSRPAPVRRQRGLALLQRSLHAPDTIVSVDTVPVGEPERWLGPSARSNWASRLNR